MNTRRTRGGTAVRDGLLEAGLDRFHAHGYAATSVQDITSAAGVPKGSFYNHFSGKEDLAVAALGEYAARSPAAVLLDRTIAPVERLRQHFDELGRRFRESGNARGCMMGNFANEVADDGGPVRAALGTLFAGWSALISMVVAEAQQSGALHTDVAPDLLASFILSAWEGSLTRARATNSSEPLDTFFEMVFRQILHTESDT